MGIENLLSQLEIVKSTGHNRWIASCPTREDKTPSMAIRLLDDERILIHDFGGSSPQEILDSIGLTFSDLHPKKLGQNFKKERKPFSASDILSCISNETTLVQIMANKMINGESLNQHDITRLSQTVERISSALEVTRGYK